MNSQDCNPQEVAHKFSYTHSDFQNIHYPKYQHSAKTEHSYWLGQLQIVERKRSHVIKRGKSESYIKSIAEQNNGTYKLVSESQIVF